MADRACDIRSTKRVCIGWKVLARKCQTVSGARKSKFNFSSQHLAIVRGGDAWIVSRLEQIKKPHFGVGDVFLWVGKPVCVTFFWEEN